MFDDPTDDQTEELERLRRLRANAKDLARADASPALRKVCNAIAGEVGTMIRELREEG